MDFKPNEFFLGLVDFTAIFLPGCLLTGVLLAIDATLLPNKLYCFALQESTSVMFWVCFTFVSYTVGYFLSSIATGLDTLFDLIRKQIYPFKEHLFEKYLIHTGINIKDKSKANKDKIDNLKIEVQESESDSSKKFESYCKCFIETEWRRYVHFFFELENRIKIDHNLDEAIAIKEICLEKKIGKELNTFQWSLLVLDTYYPVAAEKANRTMAASKFFRSLVLVCSLAFLFQCAKWLPALLPFWGWVGLTIFSFREYVVQRQKSIQAIYRGIITFYHLPDKFPPNRNKDKA